VLSTKGNVFRAVLIAIPIMIGDLYIASAIAPFITGMAKDVNFSFPEGSSGLVSSFLDGGNPLRYWILQIFSGNVLALILIPVIGIVVFWVYKVTYKQTHLLEDVDVPKGETTNG
jgi:galactitol PTS system EIIC component